VQLATLTVALQQARKTQQTAKMASCDIVAPFSGMVVNWKIRNFASVQQGVPVLELVDSTDLFVELIVPVKWIDRLAIGQVTSFTSDHSGRKYTATIDMISAAADPVSQTIRINASLSTGGNPPKVGTSGSMVFGQ
jgi:multidrug resistance efflux pump